MIEREIRKYLNSMKIKTISQDVLAAAKAECKENLLH